MKLVVAQLGCPLRECPAGLFLFDGSLHFRSEYRNENKQVEAFCLEGGEFFWGGAKSNEDREALTVTPVTLEF